MCEAKIITAKIEVIFVHTETDNNDPVNWQAALAYTTTVMFIERSPLTILCSKFYFLSNNGV